MSVSRTIICAFAFIFIASVVGQDCCNVSVDSPIVLSSSCTCNGPFVANIGSSITVEEGVTISASQIVITAAGDVSFQGDMDSSSSISMTAEKVNVSGGSIIASTSVNIVALSAGVSIDAAAIAGTSITVNGTASFQNGVAVTTSQIAFEEVLKVNGASETGNGVSWAGTRIVSDNNSSFLSFSGTTVYSTYGLFMYGVTPDTAMYTNGAFNGETGGAYGSVGVQFQGTPTVVFHGTTDIYGVNTNTYSTGYGINFASSAYFYGDASISGKVSSINANGVNFESGMSLDSQANISIQG